MSPVQTSIKLAIVTMEREVWSGEVFEFVVPCHDGYRGFRPGHAPYLTVLGTGRATLKFNRSDHVDHVFKLSGGFMEVTGYEATIFADSVIDA